ncbi:MULTISPECIES: glycosyltransferase [Streptomyces]|uniref:Glycosyltransferase n=1 Tax=Streptomyces koelreuteriae TaxID=2838015 RepID=A0ABX8FKB2_9ACTN|nr:MULTISPECIES: glycosyltransferase [Streptomyces]QWB21551.1 glycosyltransferase [Streptomyces koelreuteriae]UUA04473.1 glycosyltransferase [Streptomyces koelreuteriae]UUA12098.1 glycosyltransferase [Streptomyces sp. CRCS-T-1]
MRVLCTTLGSPSHGRAQLPLLRALSKAGHRVLVVTTEALAPVFRDDDVQVDAALPEFDPLAAMGPYLADLQENTGLTDPTAALTRLLMRHLAGPGVKPHLDILLPLARDFRPDVILRDGMDMGAVLTAELLGVPQLPTPSGFSNILDPAEVLPQLNERREELGLPGRDDPLSLVPQGRVDYVPSGFSFARHLHEAWAYRQTVDVERGAVLPEWLARLPTDRPLVYAAIGTALPVMRERMAGRGTPLPVQLPDPTESLDAIVGAAAELDDCTVVVSTSGIPVDTEGLPGHVHVADRVPQPLLLESVDLFVTHGGFNSIREAMRTGTPLAVLPHFGDQPANADRVAELGLGRHLTDRTASGIADACRGLLADPGPRARARTAQLAMLTLPEVDQAVGDLEKIAG